MGVAACFAPGTDPAVVARFEDVLFPRRPPGSRYFVGSSWSPVGEPTTLTWSLVPDGLYIPGGVGEGGGPSSLFSRMDALFGSRAVWIAMIRMSFDRWAELTGIEYVHVTAGGGVDWDDGASWGTSGDSARGDVRIAMHDIDGDSGILAIVDSYIRRSGF